MKYQELKNQLAETHELLNELEAKRGQDKPYRRELLNVQLDYMHRQVDQDVMREHYSELKGEQYKRWLENYTIQLHGK